MKDSYGTYDGRKEEPPYESPGYHRYYDRDSGRWITALDCPSCPAKDARIAELEKDLVFERSQNAEWSRSHKVNHETIVRLEKERDEARAAIEWALQNIPDQLMECFYLPVMGPGKGGFSTRAWSGEGFKAELRRRAGEG